MAVKSNPPDYSGTFGFKLPPRSKKQVLPIISPKPGKPVHAICVSDKVLTAVAHYWRRVSYPCTNDESTCSFDHSCHPPRPRGYVCAIDTTSKVMCLAELTMRACERLLDKGLFTGGLRGKKIKLYRASEAKNSEVLVHVIEPSREEALWVLPEEIDMQSALLSQWGNPFALSREELHPPE